MSRVALSFAILALGLSPQLHAQQWPVKPVRIIVNVTPGGVADTTIRAVGTKLTQAMGQTFLVENRPGADGYIGLEAVGKSDADGYTLSYPTPSSVMVTPYLINRPEFDPLKALTPVVPTAKATALYLITHPSVPATSLAQLLQYLRANPGKVNYGSPGNGTTPHISTEIFSHEAKVQLNHIPYKGAAPALQDLLGGQLGLVLDPGIGLAHAKSGKLRLLAVAGSKRHPEFPDVPTLEEGGIKDVDAGPLFGLYAPAGTPGAILLRLNQEVNRAMQDPTVKERFSALTMEIAEPMTPGQFAAYVKAQSERFAKVLPALAIKL